MSKRNKEEEEHRRIKIALWTYAKHYHKKHLVSTAQYEKEIHLLNLNIKTNRKDLDKFYKKVFNPNSTDWITKHPEIDRIIKIYRNVTLSEYEDC